MTKGLHVLFSAHGVPESYIEAGDPYQRHIEECVRLISKEVSDQLSCDSTRPLSMSKEVGLQLAGALTETMNVGSGGAVPAQFHLSFQSRVGPVQWLK
jgi:protoporphyrin/coproporphyrin ferrochelatase